MENTNKNVLISVIVPMYNVEKYLEQCVVSIEYQNYSPLELILVDDGSQDRTLEVAKGLAEKFQNIQVIYQENQGQGKARNTGLSHAKGELIAFIDADDFIEPDMLSVLAEKVLAYNLDFAECSYQDVYCEQNKKSFIYYTRVSANKVLTGQKFYEYHPVLSPCNRVYSYRFLKSFNFQFTENRFAEDAYDISNIMIHAKRAMRIDQCFYYYRRDNFGSTRNNKSPAHKIKLGTDKIFIARKLNDLRKELRVKGYISTVIVRNIFGAIFSKSIFKVPGYKKAIINACKENDTLHVFNENVSLKILGRIFIIAISKYVLKKY